MDFSLLPVFIAITEQGKPDKSSRISAYDQIGGQ